MHFNSIQHFKFVSTHKFFVQPADENYLLARWMLINGFNREFFWQAMQAIEKYLKASLVLQEISINKYSHNITELFERHCEEFGPVAFTSFEKPEELSADIWTPSNPLNYVTRISQLGDPGSRYGMVSWWRTSDDLFKIDQICWSLRRLTVGLKWVVGDGLHVPGEHEAHRGTTYSDALLADATFQPRSPIGGLDRQIHQLGSTRADTLYSWNLSYRRERIDFAKPTSPGLVPTFGPLENSYIFLFWEELTKKDENGQPKFHSPIFIEGMRWLAEHFRFTRADRETILEEVSRAEKRLTAIRQ